MHKTPPALSLSPSTREQAMAATNPALVYGPQIPPLCTKTLGALIDDQAIQLGNHTAVIVPWQSIRISYRELAERSRVLSKALLAIRGLRQGDCVGIMAGNCYQYLEVFLGAARIGCPVVVLNNTYTPRELRNAISISCRFYEFSLFLSTAFVG